MSVAKAASRVWCGAGSAGPGQRFRRSAGSAGSSQQRSRQPQREPGEQESLDKRKNPSLYSLTMEDEQASADGGSSSSLLGGAARPAAARPAVVTLPSHKPEVLAPAGEHYRAGLCLTRQRKKSRAVSGAFRVHGGVCKAAVTRRSTAAAVPAAFPGLTCAHLAAHAGGWAQLRAAVENGADAVYFGEGWGRLAGGLPLSAGSLAGPGAPPAGKTVLQNLCASLAHSFLGSLPSLHAGLSDFNARARAANFEPDELPQVMEYLHARGAKGYVVLNVLGGCWAAGCGDAG